MRFSLLLGISVLCSSASAQSLSVASPGRYLSTEGEGCADGFGSLPDYRHMLFDGELRGTAATIKEIQLREDYRDHSFSVGRAWTNVRLRISTCNLANVSRTFSANPTSTPVRVFSGVVAWPSLGGIPPSRPAAWGGRMGKLRFPFATKWTFAGTADVCLDFEFAGGILASRSTWTQRAGWYQLDGFGNGWRNPSWLVLHGSGCRDSSWSLGAALVLDSATHGKDDPNPAFRGMHVLRTQSFGTARGKPVVHAVGILGSRHGRSFPTVTCERLYLDLAVAPTFLHLNADATTSMASSPLVTVPFDPRSVGAELWAQAAWDDSQTGALRLSKASQTQIVDLPRKFARRALVGTRKGTTGPTADPSFNPILLFR